MELVSAVGLLTAGDRRWFLVRNRNANIEKRNRARQQYSQALELPDISLRRKHAGVRDEKGNPVIKDFYSNPLTASGKIHDDMLLAKFESIYTGSVDQGSSMERRERFKLPMPSEKETLTIRKMENEALLSAKSEAPTNSEIKQERPPRKRRWISN